MREHDELSFVTERLLGQLFGFLYVLLLALPGCGIGNCVESKKNPSISKAAPKAFPSASAPNSVQAADCALRFPPPAGNPCLQAGLAASFQARLCSVP